MKKLIIRKILPIFLITLFCGFISLPKTFKIAGRNIDLVLGLDLVGGSHLVFEADLSSLSGEKKPQALESLKNVIARRVNLFGVSEPNIQVSSFDGKDRVIIELPGIKDTNQAIELVGQTAQLIFAELGEPVSQGQQPQISPTDLTGADLSDARVQFDQTTGKPVVQLKFTDDGAKKFEGITERNVGKQVAIFLDQMPVSAPVVNQKITGGSAVIEGNFDLEQAKGLAIQLNAGALPVPIKLIEQRTIGATLGEESVQKSIQAGVIGLTAVLAFMMIMYGRLGVIANIGLLIFGVITLALYKLIPVVLTLPGIAGFLLSVGMAVDSNILIFERFREERRVRSNIVDALENSFGRAWDSIRDANIATLITAFVLANPLDWQFLHTSGPVRGFAITLALGIVISMFTGLYVSRNLLRLFVRQGKGER